MSVWHETRIGDVAEININTLSKDYPFEKIEYIDVSSVDKGVLLGTQKLNLKEAPSRAKRIVNKNDILISTVRPNLEHYYYVKDCKENTVASTGYAVITAKKINSYFLYYLLTRKSYTIYLTLIADGHTSTYPAFNPDVIEDSFLSIPDISEQNQIAPILSSLDSKIDLLHRQNQTLENIAQTLFKEWFIDFGFPDKDGKPYKSSGGKMVESELGEIPEGWRVWKLDDILSARNQGVNTTTEKVEYAESGIPVIRAKNINKNFIDFNDIVYIDNKTFSRINKTCKPQRYDILYTNIGSQLGNATLLLNSSNFIIAWNVIRLQVNPSLFLPELLVVYLNYTPNKKYIQNLDSSSTMPFVSGRVLGGIEIVIPVNNILRLINPLLSNIFKKINSNSNQIQTLTKARDTLLPKLMSGQIRVKSV
jgi:type I restriction enzyme, S subunit